MSFVALPTGCGCSPIFHTYYIAVDLLCGHVNHKPSLSLHERHQPLSTHTSSPGRAAHGVRWPEAGEAPRHNPIDPCWLKGTQGSSYQPGGGGARSPRTDRARERERETERARQRQRQRQRQRERERERERQPDLTALEDRGPHADFAPW